MSKRVMVLGSEIGALAAAVRLARHADVTLVAAAAEPLRLTDSVGRIFAFDRDPSPLALPFVIMDLFAAAGEDVRDHLQITRVDPPRRFHWADGSAFDLFADQRRLEDEVARIAPADVTGWNRVMFHSRRSAEQLLGPSAHPSERGQPLAWIGSLLDKWQGNTAQNFAAMVQRSVRSPRLRQVLAKTPAARLWLDHYYGLWYVAGGMDRLRDALLALARRRGAHIMEEPGPEIAGFDAVVEDAAVESPHTWLLLGIHGSLPKLAHQNLFQPRPESAAADEPTLWVCSPSRTDRSLVAGDCETLLLRLPRDVPAKQESRTRLIERLSHFEAMKGVDSRVVVEGWIEPPARGASSDATDRLHRLENSKYRGLGIAGAVLAAKDAARGVIEAIS